MENQTTNALASRGEITGQAAKATGLEDMETDDLISQVAEIVKSRNMETSLIFLLEAHRPLRGMLYHGAVFCSPLFSPFLGGSKIDVLLRIMEDEESVNKLILALES